MTSFEPGPGSSRALRDALGRFATGVTVVTADTDKGPVGITANSFASVSLDPPLVLWSPAKASTRYAHFECADHYAIHVLGETQKPLADRFARAGHHFDGLDWAANDDGVPLLSGVIARFECRQVACHDAGDHLIIVGRIARVHSGEGKPLLFAGGCFGRFTRAA